MSKLIPVCLLLTAATLLSASQQPDSTASPHNTRLLSSRKEPPMPMPLVAPLFIENGMTHSTITLVNNFSKPLDIDVVLSDLEGNQIAKSAVTIDAYSPKKVEIADVLSQMPWAATSGYGSVLLSSHTATTLAAQLSIVNQELQNDMEEEFVMMMGSYPANYRAVAANLSTTPIVAVRSTSATDQTISVTCLSETGPLDSSNLTIGPNQTLLLRVCRGTGPQTIANLDADFASLPGSKKAVGVAVSSLAPSMDLAVFGIAVHGEGTQRLLSGIPFWAPDTLKSSTAVYPGVPAAQNLAFGGQSFQLFATLANFSPVPQQATVLLSAGSGKDSTQKTIGSVTVPGQSVSTVDLPELPAGAAVSNSIVVQSGANPGEVLSNVQAVAQGTVSELAFTLPWRDQQQFNNAGEHPWTVSDSNLATVLLFNPDRERTNDSVQLAIRAGQTVWTKQVSLAPMATTTISLNEIVKKQEPDAKGQKLPLNSSEGIVTWYTWKNPRIFGKLVQLDELAGTPRNYACSYGQVLCGMEVPETSILVGQQGTIYTLGDGCPSDPNSYSCGCTDVCSLGGAAATSETWQSVQPSSSSDPNSIATPYDQWGIWQGNSVGWTTALVNACDSNNCCGPGNGQLDVVSSPCSAQMWYRPLVFGGVTFGNHSFWWIQKDDSIASPPYDHYVIDGGPAGNCPDAAGCGNLLDWVTYGETGHYPEDNPNNPNASLDFDSRLDASKCVQVQQLFNYGVNWDEGRYTYYLDGPNSNTFAHYAGAAAGFGPSAPPNSPGWNTTLN